MSEFEVFSTFSGVENRITPTQQDLYGLTSDPTRIRQRTVSLFLFVMLSLAAGIASWWWYLEREHRRLEAWKGAAIWAGDFIALLWFLQFCFVHCFRPESSAPRAPARRAAG